MFCDWSARSNRYDGKLAGGQAERLHCLRKCQENCLIASCFNISECQNISYLHVDNVLNVISPAEPKILFN